MLAALSEQMECGDGQLVLCEADWIDRTLRRHEPRRNPQLICWGRRQLGKDDSGSAATNGASASVVQTLPYAFQRLSRRERLSSLVGQPQCACVKRNTAIPSAGPSTLPSSIMTKGFISITHFPATRAMRTDIA